MVGYLHVKKSDLGDEAYGGQDVVFPVLGCFVVTKGIPLLVIAHRA